jgi:hypothetical protein
VELKMLGAELKRIRLGIKMPNGKKPSQSQMAILLGYTHFSRISYFETDKNPIPKTTARLARMLQIYGVPSEWLMEICQR